MERALSRASPRSCATSNHVADRFDLRRDIQFDTRVTAARFDDDAEHAGRSSTDAGDASRRRYCVTARGCLRRSSGPTSRASTTSRASGTTRRAWPHEGVDFTGKRVGVIGTGSTGSRRSRRSPSRRSTSTSSSARPNYSVPARNRPLDPDELSARSRRLPRATARSARVARSRRAVRRRRALGARGDRRGAPRASTRTAGSRAASARSRGQFNDCSRAPRRTTRPRSSCATRSARS